MARSLLKQVNDALDRVTRIGQSRHQAKADGTAARLIFSHSTRTTYADRCITAVRWVVEQRPDLTQLRDLTAADVRAYIRHCEEQELSGGHIRGALAALRKLEHGMRALRWWTARHPLVPADLGTTIPRSTARMGFSWPDAHRIIAGLDHAPEAQLATRLALSAGLRISEIARLREQDLDRTHGTITVRSGKGGLTRVITHLHDPRVLADLPTGRNWLFDNPGNLVRRVQKHIALVRDTLAIDGGTGRNAHSFRAAYAERFLRQAIEHDGISEDRARSALSVQMGHTRRSVTYRYCPRLTPKTTTPRRNRPELGITQPLPTP